MLTPTVQLVHFLIGEEVVVQKFVLQCQSTPIEHQCKYLEFAGCFDLLISNHIDNFFGFCLLGCKPSLWIHYFVVQHFSSVSTEDELNPSNNISLSLVVTLSKTSRQLVGSRHTQQQPPTLLVAEGQASYGEKALSLRSGTHQRFNAGSLQVLKIWRSCQRFRIRVEEQQKISRTWWTESSHNSIPNTLEEMIHNPSESSALFCSLSESSTSECWEAINRDPASDVVQATLTSSISAVQLLTAKNNPNSRSVKFDASHSRNNLQSQRSPHGKSW